ncbi:MAG: molecular chaperone DnaK, partial [Planctomycetales bacterium]
TEGGRVTPSVVAYTSDGETLVGETAARQAATNAERTVFSIKRFIGRRFDDLQEEISTAPFRVERGVDNYARVVIGDQQLIPPEISAQLLRYLKSAAEDYLGQSVNKAIITVPAYFNDAQRQATRDAGRIAGLQVERIITEPNAAALAYGLQHQHRHKIAVFDLGGGTFDISILEVGDGVFDVLSTSGDTRLGGDDFDRVLLSYVANEFREAEGADLIADPPALQRLREACEKAKRDLSVAGKTDLNLPFIAMGTDGAAKHLNVSITRSQFEILIDPLVQRCIPPVVQALRDAGLEADAIDEVVLVGGSTRVPRIQELVTEIFGRKPHKGVNPDEVVAGGAALQGAALSGEGGAIAALLDVTPLTLGVETQGGVMAPLIERNTHIPTSRRRVFTTVEDDQAFVVIRAFQGEEPRTCDNQLLGQFVLEDIPREGKGIPQVEVLFDVDVNGILHVSAIHMGTGREQTVRIEQSCALDDHQVDRLRADSQASADQLRNQQELVEARNQADSAGFRLEKFLDANKNRLDQDQCEAIQAALDQKNRIDQDNDALALKHQATKLDEYLEVMQSALGAEDPMARVLQNLPLPGTDGESVPVDSAPTGSAPIVSPSSTQETRLPNELYDFEMSSENELSGQEEQSTELPHNSVLGGSEGEVIDTARRAMDSGKYADLMKLRDYQLVSKVGEGGMGSVYRALHTQLDKEVAVKVLPPDRLNNAQSVARFKREMRAVGRLDHPNIVRATDAGEVNGIHFLVMELIEGVDAGAVVEDEEPTSISNACEIVRQAALGLQHAYENGMVHRDVKPSNVLLSNDGAVKLLDLGLALLNSDQGALSQDLTQSEFIMGTVDYLAPEQADDTHQVDVRADIYGLGCTLYHLLVGKVPYDSEQYVTPLNKMIAHAQAPVPLVHEHRSGAPEALSDVVARMMA